MAADTGALDSDEGLKRRRHRHWFDRLMMLADGVFAIAITFLAADITTQAGWDGRWASLWPHLSAQLDAYATSFVVIAIYWLAHRRFMAMILTVDAPVIMLEVESKKQARACARAFSFQSAFVFADPHGRGPP